MLVTHRVHVESHTTALARRATALRAQLAYFPQVSEAGGTGSGAAPKMPMKRSSGTRVPTYHSINQSDPDVHHNHNDCPSGQQIPAYNRRLGTNGWPLCRHCASM